MKPFRAIATGDIHIRDDSADDLFYGMQVLDDLASMTLGRGLQTVIINGDFFDSKRRHSTTLLLAVADKLLYWKLRGVHFIICRGNHDSIDMMQEPELTALSLFQASATIINTPTLVEEEDAVIFLLPWYPPGPFRKLLQEFAKVAIGYSKKRILITHVSVQEGLVSPSNTKIATAIRLKDLLAPVWTGGIYLSDYHRAQVLSEGGRQVGIYMGAPRPLTHGDSHNLGAWEICSNFDSRAVIPLPSRYPTFNSFRIDQLSDLPLQEFDARNKNRIYCPLHLQRHIAELYPGTPLLSTEEKPILDGGRLSEVEAMDTMSIFDKYLSTKKLGEVYREAGKKFLGGVGQS